MGAYEVWGTSDPNEWPGKPVLETDDRQEALRKADSLIHNSGFRFVAVDHLGRTIWSNDPDTPAETD